MTRQASQENRKRQRCCIEGLSTLGQLQAGKKKKAAKALHRKVKRQGSTGKQPYGTQQHQGNLIVVVCGTFVWFQEIF